MKRLSKTKKILIGIALILLLLMAGGAMYLYPAFTFFFQTETQQFDKDLTLVLGGGGNSGILITDKALVVIDTKMGGAADDLFKLASEKAAGKPILVINTHYHGDHVNGNHFYKGSRIYIGNYDKAFLQKEVDPNNMPTDYVKDSLVLELGNETFILYDLGQAHTYHDMVVYLKNRKILFSGDLIFHHINPLLKKKSGADVDKWLAALHVILNKFDLEKVVPGHGSIGGKELVWSMVDYFRDMKAAEKDPSRANELKAKYKDWVELPNMTSPQATIDYIREVSH
ncbi:MAG: MBL fold metallo-hydrolase [Bacteroidales bacterium]|jgi:glyoxylase-like metal-dependent hydrolase (beta-lactamase superfamily II)